MYIHDLYLYTHYATLHAQSIHVCHWVWTNMYIHRLWVDRAVCVSSHSAILAFRHDPTTVFLTLVSVAILHVYMCAHRT